MEVVRQIVGYESQVLRMFLRIIKEGYEKSKKIMIPYDVWAERSLNTIYSNPQSCNTMLITPGVVRVTDTKTLYTQLKSIEKEVAEISDLLTLHPEKTIELNQKLFELQKEAFKPLHEFKYDGVTEIAGRPSWFASSINGVNLRVGPKDLDISNPVGFSLGDKKVHANIQGMTGSGKTTLMMDMLFNTMLEYPPWELDLKLIDNKIAEFHLFGRAVQTIHASLVAATKSKDFLLDLYKSFVSETNMRQALFSATQVKDKKGFIKKFNLILPEIVIIIDEYVAMLQAFADSEAEGNKEAGEEKAAIESVLLTLATQSRNAGIHFIISSQDLGSKLNQNISKQLHSGLTLSATVDIYNSCINNTEVNIDRQGMCVLNQERSLQDNAKYNQVIGVPYIITDPVEDKLFNPAQELLIEMRDKATTIGFSREFSFYDAEVKIPNSEYQTELLDSINGSRESSGEILYQFPLGKVISYKNPITAKLQIHSRKSDNIIYNSKDETLSRYVAQILLTTASMTCSNLLTNIYYTEPTAYEISELSELNIEKNVERLKMLSPDHLAMYKQRSLFMRVQELVFDKSKRWDLNTLMNVVAAIQPRNSIMSKYKNKCETEVIAYLNSQKKPEDRLLLHDGIDKEDLTVFDRFLQDCRMCCVIRETQNLSATKKYISSMFKPVINFWFGIEDIDNLSEDWVREGLLDYFTGSTTVNILNVANLYTPFKVRKLLSGFNNVIEFADNAFWSELETSGRFKVNINKDSLTIHDIRKATNLTVKIYGGI